MRRWFLSYHSPDQALAERLKAALERKDTDARVFFSPASLRAGGFWSRALAEEIAQADAFILLVGERGVGDWQELEYDEALDKRVKFPDFPVILVLLESQAAPGLPFLRRLHWIITPDPSSEKDVARLLDAASGSGATPGDLWRYTQPYRGLAAMTEKDSDYFFGREEKTVEVIKLLAIAPGQVTILLGNSGVGKSSVAQAGVMAALKRQDWPERAYAPPEWPQAFRESRRWCFVTLKPGTEPLKALVEAFLDTWQLGATDPERVKQQNGWIELLRDGKVMLRDLLDATERRYKELDRTKPPAFLLYVDQGEELYVRAEERQCHRFSEVIAQGLADPHLYMLISMRSDFLGELQKDEPLFKVHRKIDVPPLREAELREVVSRPAEQLSARFETAGLADIITRRTAEDSVKDVGALPLLSYTLDDMWTQMVKRADGVLRLPAQSFELGGVLVDRADAFLAAHPKSQDELRRIFTLKLATVREGEEPTRRRALRSEFTDEEWRLVTELADHPNRLLVTATPEGGEAYAEVAHEAIFRRWEKLREWIAAEREFLAWKTGLEAARRAWQATSDSSKDDALLMGVALPQAQSWLGKRREDLSTIDQDFIDQSIKRDNKARGRTRRIRALIYVLLVGIIAGLVGWINQSYLKEQWNWYTIARPYRVANIDPYVLKPEAERALTPGNSFRECAKDCPEMVVVPAGEFMMGSPVTEEGRQNNEGPQLKVVLAKPFAVSKFDVTFADWDACVSVGGCPQVGDDGFGRGTRPVINVSWNDAQQYVAWLSNMTGGHYRLLSEAEWEYAARAGSTAAYFWGNEIGKGNANCSGCGSQWDNRQTSPVGSFAPNAFGLHDMAGNVWQWVQDCYHVNYNGAPTDGSAWVVDHCTHRALRGGSWGRDARDLRSAARNWLTTDSRVNVFGFRLGRSLNQADLAERKKADKGTAVEAGRAEEDAARGDPALSVEPGSGQSFRDQLADGKPCPTCPEMVVVPKGKFTMGSPYPELQRYSNENQVPVSIAKPFAVGKFAVTRSEFATFVKETGYNPVGGCFILIGSDWKQEVDKSWRAPGFVQNELHPVVCVDWEDAKTYTEWLSTKTGKAYRLLSEAEREYVTRAGTMTPFWWGTSITPTQANYNGNFLYTGGGLEGEYRQRTVPVDSFEPNPWGLYNVHGNVREWTEDCWVDSNSGNPGNGNARTTGDCGRRVVRGGSWDLSPDNLRSASRYGSSTDLRISRIGFRVGRMLTP